MFPLGLVVVDPGHLLQGLADVVQAVEQAVLAERVNLEVDDAERGANAVVSIDLEKQEIAGPDGGTIHFEIDPFRKHCLLNGLDDIGQTLEKAGSIDTYEAKQKIAQPWL